VIGVDPNVIERIDKVFPHAKEKTEMLTVSVNTDVFPLARSFPPLDAFRLAFAGRLDRFKRPDLMFRVIHELRTRHRVNAEWHYIGGSDPNLFPEFDLIRGHAVIHGTRTSAEVATILADCHAGILVSDFEGMPVFVLELLAVGRPLGGLELPQLGLVVEPGVSGELAERSGDERADVSAAADALSTIRADIEAGRLDPAEIRKKIEPYSHRTQLARLFGIHRDLQAEHAHSHA
jgi:glycosyltransferase involved in cell wall biosynthesis